MPSNDGTPLTCYVLMQSCEIEFRRISYDHTAAQVAMQAVGLTQGYDTALATGYWPSEEVLPPDLRRAALANG